MQLLFQHPSGSEPQQVIHIIQRELPPATDAPPPQQLAPSTPERGTGHEASEAPEVGNASADGPQTPRATRSNNPFDDPVNQGDVMMYGIEETSREDSLRDMDTHMTSVNTAGPSNLNTFVDNHQYYASSSTSLTTHGYNSSLQSTFDSFIDSLDPPQLVEPRRQGIIDLPIQQTLLLPDAAYPEFIHDTLAFVSDLPPAKKKFYPLWNHLLEYWFPSTQGFEILQDWDPKSSFQAHQIIQSSEQPIPRRPKPSFAVFDITSPTEPFLFVQIQNALTINNFTKRQARITAEETFETLRACSFCADFKTLAVVSAVGARWGMVMREPGWLPEDETGCSGDYVGEWEQDATSSESFRVMGYCFEEIKRNVEIRRQS